MNLQCEEQTYVMYGNYSNISTSMINAKALREKFFIEELYDLREIQVLQRNQRTGEERIVNCFEFAKKETQDICISFMPDKVLVQTTSKPEYEIVIKCIKEVCDMFKVPILRMGYNVRYASGTNTEKVEISKINNMLLGKGVAPFAEDLLLHESNSIMRKYMPEIDEKVNVRQVISTAKAARGTEVIQNSLFLTIDINTLLFNLMPRFDFESFDDFCRAARKISNQIENSVVCSAKSMCS